MEYVLSFFGLSYNFGQKIDNGFLRGFLHLKDHFIPHHRNNYHPHVLGHRSLALFSVLLVSVKIFSIAAISFGPVEPVFSSAITETNIVNLTNASRSSYGLGDLGLNEKLSKAAQAKAEDMLLKGYFSHNTPEGKSPWDFITAAEYNYLTAGENLAVNFTEAEDVENAWMNSPGHKANILNKNFEEIGVGIAQGIYQGRNAVFVVQMFGSSSEQKIVLDDKPTPVAPPSSVAQKPVVESANQSLEPRAAISEPAESGVVKSNLEKPVLTESKLPSFETTELKINQTSLVQEGKFVKLTAQVVGEPVKVLAKFGKSAVLMQPKSDGKWVGEIDLSGLAENNSGLVLEAYSMNGNKVNSQVAGFAGSTVSNFNVLPNSETAEKRISLFGKTFSPTSFEQKFYLVAIAGLLSCLILAIGIKRHIQHLSLIANTSFVVVLAIGFWLK